MVLYSPSVSRSFTTGPLCSMWNPSPGRRDRTGQHTGVGSRGGYLQIAEDSVAMGGTDIWLIGRSRPLVTPSRGTRTSCCNSLRRPPRGSVCSALVVPPSNSEIRHASSDLHHSLAVENDSVAPVRFIPVIA